VSVRVNLFANIGIFTLYNILIEFVVPIKSVRLIKMCLNETYIKVCIGKYIFDNFSIQNGLKYGDDLLPLLFNLASGMSLGRSRKTRWD
jgi:hypothetical protein